MSHHRRIQKLENIIEKAKAEIEEIQAKHVEQMNRPKLGRFFKCRTLPDEAWNFIAITKVSGSLIEYELPRFFDGKAQTVVYRVSGVLTVGEEITEEEYEAEIDRLRTLARLVRCPHCKGAKMFVEYLSMPCERPRSAVVKPCHLCNGNGQVSQMKAAVYETREGLEPTQFKGYA